MCSTPPGTLQTESRKQLLPLGMFYDTYMRHNILKMMKTCIEILAQDAVTS